MILSEEARAAAKKAQLARLAAKGTPEYPALYASQPTQQRKAAEYKVQRQALHDAKQAINRAVVQAADEAVDVFSAVDGNMEVQ